MEDVGKLRLEMDKKIKNRTDEVIKKIEEEEKIKNEEIDKKIEGLSLNGKKEVVLEIAK